MKPLKVSITDIRFKLRYRSRAWWAFFISWRPFMIRNCLQFMKMRRDRWADSLWNFVKFEKKSGWRALLNLLTSKIERIWISWDNWSNKVVYLAYFIAWYFVARVRRKRQIQLVPHFHIQIYRRVKRCKAERFVKYFARQFNEIIYYN